MWISVSGRIGSGKTTLARALRDRYGATYIGIGDFVRAHARSEGVPLERRRLQELGARLIEAAGGDGAFICRVVAAATANAEADAAVVVDGVRSEPMRAELNALAGRGRVLHVHVEVPEATRRARLHARGDTDADVANADADASERNVDELRVSADLVAPGDDLQAALELIAHAASSR